MSLRTRSAGRTRYVRLTHAAVVVAGDPACGECYVRTNLSPVNPASTRASRTA